jgi:hypothetical protein
LRAFLLVDRRRIRFSYWVSRGELVATLFFNALSASGP